MTVYVIMHHVRGEEEASFLGVYATRELAESVLAAQADGDSDYEPGSGYYGTCDETFEICETGLIGA